MTWTYKGQEINGHDDLHPDCTDIVYQIEYEDGRCYIGKKAVRSLRKKPPLKGKKRSRRVMTNHPFMKYEGSHNKIGLVVKTKEILYQCSTRKASTYLETALLFHHDAIFDPAFVNENIGGKFFDNDLNGLIKDESYDAPVYPDDE
jgi:hypothetical protein